MPFCASCGSPMEGRFCAKCGASAGAAASPAGAPIPPASATPVAQSMPMAENLAACLCYALTIITGVLFLILEPYNKNRNIRFHAFQAIFVGLAMIIGRIALSIVFGIMSTLSGWFLFAGISLLYSLACLILWVYLMLMAYQGKKIVLPVIGPLAQAQAG